MPLTRTPSRSQDSFGGAFPSAVLKPLTPPPPPSRRHLPGEQQHLGALSHTAPPSRPPTLQQQKRYLRAEGHLHHSHPGLSLATRHHLPPPPPTATQPGVMPIPPPKKNWAKFPSGPLANQKFSLAPLAPVNLDRKISSAPLKTQHHQNWGGWEGPDPLRDHRSTRKL